MRKSAVLGLSFALLVSAALATTPAFAKKWTVTERITKLSNEIDEGRKANELTTSQVEALKKSVDSIKNKMDKMKEKNGNKLSLPDTRKLHDEMTNLSVKIYRQRLENVYAD